MSIFEIILVICCGIYISFIVWCIAGWGRIPVFNGVAHRDMKHITVVLPVRNEEKLILTCLASLYAQSYSKALFEVIVVDDDSSDTTEKLVQEFIQYHKDFNCRLVKLDKGQGAALYKKCAIEKAVLVSNGEMIITTDADCVFPVKWIETVMLFQESSGAGFISGPVVISEEKSFVERFQSLEFLGLVGMGAASIKNGKPIMCNGANIAYRKSIFLQAGGYSHDTMVSGDDTHLLRKIHLHNTGKIAFVKSPDACVHTRAMHSWTGLLQQRIRWASKIPAGMSSFTLFLGATAYFLHVGILWSLVSGHEVVACVVWLAKALVEFLFLLKLTMFFRKNKLLRYFIPAQLIYPVYITLLGVLSLNGSFSWKGRGFRVKRNVISR